VTWLIAGLGNPGPAYAATRHNIGAMVIESFAETEKVKLARHKRALALTGETHIGSPGSVEKLVLAFPLSFMNESGGPVKALMDFYGIDSNHLIVVHDELDIEYGTLRLKFGGGDNGHNGLKSIRKSLGTGDFYRERLGVGRPVGRQSPADYVLSPFSSTERKELPEIMGRGMDAIESLIFDGLDIAQSKFNS
jgi:PTH1 family peptidyl-tRNA hydrolase